MTTPALPTFSGLLPDGTARAFRIGEVAKAQGPSPARPMALITLRDGTQLDAPAETYRAIAAHARSSAKL